MFVTLTLAAISARSDIEPEALYVGTVGIDIAIVELLYQMI